MADDDITSADYQRFINKKGINPTCPLCQQRRWALVGETDGRSYGLTNTTRAGPELSDMRTAPLLMLVCQNCAFVAPILREAVAREL